LVEFAEADPLGYIYCDKTGKIVTGGTISITGPGMAFILADGSEGMYQWLTDGTPGVYTMTYRTRTCWYSSLFIRLCGYLKSN